MILNDRAPAERPLLSVSGQRADLRVHSVEPIITSGYGERAHEARWLEGEYPLAALQVHEGRNRAELFVVAGILAVRRTLTEPNGFVGVFMEPDDFHGAANLLLGGDRTSVLLSI